MERSRAFTFHPMDEASARAISVWRYDEPYDVYNPGSDSVEEMVQAFLDPEYAYNAMTDERGDVVGYCCFGPDGRVPWGEYDADALDVGMGMRPDLTGQGRGLTYVNAVLDHGRRTFAPTAFRVTVAEFNTRARRMCKRAGFRPAQRFCREQDNRAFVVLMRYESN